MRYTEMVHIAKVTLGSPADQSPARERPSTVAVQQLTGNDRVGSTHDL